MLSSGINVIGKGVVIKPGTVIERNVRIFSHASDQNIPLHVPSSQTIK